MLVDKVVDGVVEVAEAVVGEGVEVLGENVVLKTTAAPVGLEEGEGVEE